MSSPVTRARRTSDSYGTDSGQGDECAIPQADRFERLFEAGEADDRLMRPARTVIHFSSRPAAQCSGLAARKGFSRPRTG
jgi:hypothetical protein